MRRRGARGAPRGAGGWLAIVLLLAASAFVAWQVVKASSVDAFLKTNPFMAAQIAPNDPRVPIAIAMVEFRARGGAVRPQTRNAAVAALDRAPLADEPFFLAGMQALVAGDEAKAERLLAEARRRNPRSRYPRLILLDRYLRTGRIDEATAEMTALSNLIPNAGEVLVAELGRLARAPATARALEGALRKNPAQRDRLLEHLAATGADADLILRLGRIPPASAGAPWQARLVSALVERGEVQRAYSVWRAFSAPRAPERKSGLYDAALRGLPGFAPFNWYYPGTAAGVAERSPSGLQVEFYGRDTAELAAQLLMLPPGRHRLAFVAEGSADGESSRIGWKVQCLQSKAELIEIALKRVDYSPKRVAGEFVVPTQGCTAQWLRLVGTAAEFIKPQNATLRDLQLTAVR